MAIDEMERQRKRERTHFAGLRTVYGTRIHYSLTILMTDERKALLRRPLRSSSSSNNTTITSFSTAKPLTIWIKNDRPVVIKCNSYNFAKTIRRQTTQSFGAIIVPPQVTRLTAAYRLRCGDGIHFIRRAANAIQINSDVNVNQLHRHSNSNGSDIRRVQQPRHRRVRVNCVAANRWPHQRNCHRYHAAVEWARAAVATIH